MARFLLREGWGGAPTSVVVLRGPGICEGEWRLPGYWRGRLGRGAFGRREWIGGGGQAVKVQRRIGRKAMRCSLGGLGCWAGGDRRGCRWAEWQRRGRRWPGWRGSDSLVGALGGLLRCVEAVCSRGGDLGTRAIVRKNRGRGEAPALGRRWQELRRRGQELDGGRIPR